MMCCSVSDSPAVTTPSPPTRAAGHGLVLRQLHTSLGYISAIAVAVGTAYCVNHALNLTVQPRRLPYTKSDRVRYSDSMPPCQAPTSCNGSARTHKLTEKSTSTF